MTVQELESRPQRILLLNQCFTPDTVSTAQHAGDLAESLAARGHYVAVLTSSRAYDDPSVRFPKRENCRGAHVFRIACTGLGKSQKWRRLVDFLTFLIGCAVRLMFLGRFDTVIALTSPPLISVFAALFVKWKGGRLVCWVMDMNPDEAIAAGWMRADSIPARVLEGLSQFSFRVAEEVVVLDRFMRERVAAKGVPVSKVRVIPPWAHNDAVHHDSAGRRSFREKHGLSGKHVVMYSGNHSPCHPLDTLLKAALRLRDRAEIAFCFVGGGSEFRTAREFASRHGLKNTRHLPYQPMDGLAASLSAADLHLVVMGERFAGVVHPCKIYNILAVGVPVLYIGPQASHVTDILSDPDLAGRMAPHGDVDEVVRIILESTGRSVPDVRLQLRAEEFSQQRLLPRMVEVIDSTVSTPERAVPRPANELDLSRIKTAIRR